MSPVRSIAAVVGALLALGVVGAPGVAFAQDPERAPTAACRAAPVLTDGVTVRGTTAGASDVFHASCAREALSPDRVFVLRLAADAHVALRVTADYDAALYVRTRCDDPVSELACNDDASDARHAALDLDLPAGTYYVFVDGYDLDSAGTFELRVSAHARVASRAASRAPARSGGGGRGGAG